MKFEWAPSPLVTLPCVFLKILMWAVAVRCQERVLYRLCFVLSNPAWLGEPASPSSFREEEGTVHGSQSTWASQGTGDSCVLR